MLDVDGVNVFYGDLQALWGVSFKVKEEETVAIIGSNCAGKTTTLNTISGILRPRSGSMEFQGHRIDKLSPHRIVELGIAQIPEGRQLFPSMTVMENLEMGASVPEAWRNRDRTKEWVFELFPILEERKTQMAGTLSGGEQQMLAIGRGLMSMPKLLMLDEPSLGLAPMLVLKTFEMIERIRKEGVSILIVEQNVHHALELADRGYVLETGKITTEGESEELRNNEHVKKAYLGL
ncbi:MAG: ABC transporter ATP-binding protein [Candidatus Bathyarchaeota archaeon]|nr:ABC transporter ATP-binding protein [Candidatus Bathyarchaeota archaeon]